ncbi:hypothetical protein MMC26_006959 [Xylographa opegraphella]|nr:hypothetical protein [Xylographa opegraphella]
MDPGSLSDEQIDLLLRNAEARLSGHLRDQNETSILNVQTGQAKIPVGRLRLDLGTMRGPYVIVNRDIAKADTHRLLDDHERQLSSKIRRFEDPLTVTKKVIKSSKETAGPDWLNLPRTNLTHDLKRDLQLLKLRSVLDPRRHYKKDNISVKAPEFSQVGTIVEDPTEFFSARLQNKDRRGTLLEEVMVGEASSGRFKSKYNEVQLAKRSGRKAHYKMLKAKRNGAFCN